MLHRILALILSAIFTYALALPMLEGGLATPADTDAFLKTQGWICTIDEDKASGITLSYYPCGGFTHAS